MINKTLLTFASVIALSFNMPVAMADNHAKAMPDLNTQFEVQHDIREAERRAIVATNLQLSDAESEKFWPLYDAFRNKVKDQEKAGQNLLYRMAKTFGNIPQDQAEGMVSEAMTIESNVEKISRDHINELKGVISGAKLFRYFQINARLNAIFEYQLTQKVPLIPAEDQ